MLNLQMKKRLVDFFTKMQFYTVWKKLMKPPMSLDVDQSLFCLKHTLTVFIHVTFFSSGIRPHHKALRDLPTLFPSPTAPSKKLVHDTKAPSIKWWFVYICYICLHSTHKMYLLCLRIIPTIPKICCGKQTLQCLIVKP